MDNSQPGNYYSFQLKSAGVLLERRSSAKDLGEDDLTILKAKGLQRQPRIPELIPGQTEEKGT